MSRLHVAGWFENQDGAATLQPLAALVDPLVPGLFPVEATDFLRVDPSMPVIVGVHANVDATVQPRARLVHPSFRTRYGRTALELPTLSSVAEPGSPHAYNDLRSSPIVCQGGERLSVETVNDPAAAADQFVIAIFGDSVPAPASLQGAVPMRFITTAAALTANTWNSRALTADEDLLEGEYEILGGKALSTSAIAARLAIPGQDARPPIAAADARTDVVAPIFQPGQLGVLGRFRSTNLPTLELLADAADNEVQVVDLWLRRVGATR